MKFLKQILRILRYGRSFAILDPRDSSITLSPALFKKMKAENNSHDPAQTFVFFIPDSRTYAFAVSPPLDSPTQLCNIQYNPRHRCIGFETLCPTVSRILFDYSIFDLRPHTFKISTLHTHGQRYYTINPPSH